MCLVCLSLWGLALMHCVKVRFPLPEHQRVGLIVRHDVCCLDLFKCKRNCWVGAIVLVLPCGPRHCIIFTSTCGSEHEGELYCEVGNVVPIKRSVTLLPMRGSEGGWVRVRYLLAYARQWKGKICFALVLTCC